MTADYIAGRMGLPDELRWDSKVPRECEGLVALRFVPDRRDRFYRPTILDSLGHVAFRPGPTDINEDGQYRYGLTRCFEPSELRSDPAVMVPDRIGQQEVIMPNRTERFTSSSLCIAGIWFFEAA